MLITLLSLHSLVIPSSTSMAVLLLLAVSVLIFYTVYSKYIGFLPTVAPNTLIAIISIIKLQ